MNVQSFAMPAAAYMNPTAWGDLSGSNYLVWLVSHLLADQKMMAIFSMLFGAGIVLFAERAEARGLSAAKLHYRRTFWLAVFGCLHAYLLWYGDILFLYAVCGAVVFWRRKQPPKRLIAEAAVLLAVGSLSFVSFGLTMPSWPPEAQRELIEKDWRPTPERLEAELAAYRGGWLAQMDKRVPTAFEFQTFFLAAWGFWRASGMMLLGMALYKLGVFHASRCGRFYGRMLAAGAAVGLALAAYGVHWQFAHEWGPSSLFLGTQFNYWGSVAASLGWAGAAMLVCRSGALGWLRDRLAAVGQLAFSNYILHTVLGTAIFYGHGLGLFGSVERTGQIAIVFAIWALQLALSPVWLRHFRYGPLEWLWRGLTYGQLQPLRRAA